MKNLFCLCFIIYLMFSFSDLKATEPNIILIFVDDLGYGDINLKLNGLEAFNNPNIITPNLAKLASQSLVYTDHYASSPVCSPSRAGLLTGRTPIRCNINSYINDKGDNEKIFLHGSEITMAEMLKNKGYQTAIFGKWHLNGADWEDKNMWNGWTGSFPKQQGFDYGMVTKENPHFTRLLEVNTQKHPGDFFSVDGNPLGAIKGYTSDILCDSACSWIQKANKSGKPFFVYLPFDAVHIRITAADKYEALYNTGDARRDTYYANISHLDAAIGRLIKYIDQLGVSENTIVIFSSDNGPDVMRKFEFSYFCYGTSYPLSGSKFQLYQGGIRVPGMVRWPGKIEPKISSEPNCTYDLFPTFCQLTGQKLPDDRAYDGASLLDNWLHDKKVKRETPLYWQIEDFREFEKVTGEGYQRRIMGNNVSDQFEMLPHVLIRDEDYVMFGFSNKKYKTPTVFKLYNIVSDPDQNNDLASSNKEKFEEMRDKLLAKYKNVNKDRIKTIEAINQKQNKIIFQKMN